MAEEMSFGKENSRTAQIQKSLIPRLERRTVNRLTRRLRCAVRHFVNILPQDCLPLYSTILQNLNSTLLFFKWDIFKAN